MLRIALICFMLAISACMPIHVVIVAPAVQTPTALPFASMTAEPTNTPTESSTPTFLPSATQTATFTVAPTETPTHTPSVTSTPTPTFTQVATMTSAPTSTPPPIPTAMIVNLVQPAPIPMFAPELDNVRLCFNPPSNKEFSFDQWNNESSLCSDQSGPNTLFCSGADYGYLNAASYICKWDALQTVKFGINTQAYTNMGCSLYGNNTGNGGYILGLRWAPVVDEGFYNNSFYRLSALKSITLRTSIKVDWYDQSTCPPAAPLGNGAGVQNSQAHISVILTRIINGAGERVFYYQMKLWDNRTSVMLPGYKYQECSPFQKLVVEPVTRYGISSPTVGGNTVSVNVDVLSRVRELIASCAGGNPDDGSWFITGVTITTESLNTAIATYIYSQPQVRLTR